MPAPIIPARTRVLSIPELLDLIFSFTHPCREDILNATCVCKQWSEIALDSLWRTVDGYVDLLRLFNVLAPIASHGSHWSFTRLLEPDDWTRFERYAKRVRTLRFHESHSKCSTSSLPLMQDLFDTTARTRPSLAILPNLHTLEWTATTAQSTSFAMLFMHTSIKHLVISLVPSPSPSPSHGPLDLPLLKHIPTRLPNLTTLDLRTPPQTPTPMRLLSHAISPLLAALPSLAKLVVPNYHLTPPILAVLARLPRLATVQFEYAAEQGIGDVADIMSGWTSISTSSSGAFPALVDLSLTLTLPSATAFFAQPHAPANLTTLYIGAPTLQTPAALHSFLMTLGGTCRFLETLILELLVELCPPPLTRTSSHSSSSFTAETPNQQQEQEDDQQITFETLSPLLSFPLLTTFELTHEYPLRLAPADVEALARGWPGVETLVLGCEPVVLGGGEDGDGDGTLTLHSLIPFARYCPKLRHLGLFMHASPLPFSPSSPSLDTDKTKDTDRDTDPTFHALTKLSVGVSDIRAGDARSVALFLARLCPKLHIIEGGVTWRTNTDPTTPTPPPNAPAEETLPDLSRRCTLWKEVERLIPMLVSVRAEERARRARLEREVGELRVRNRVLMDREKVGRGRGRGEGCVVA